MPNLSLRNTSIVILAAISTLAATSQTPAATTPPPALQTCTVVTTPPSEGDLAIAKEDYDAALAFFRAAVAANPTSEEAHLGLVRALIGKDQVAEALKESADGLTRWRYNAIAEVAAAEAAFRNANFDSARAHLKEALLDDPCEGRADAGLARYYAVNAYFATEAHFIDNAHKLRPNDELIRRAWIQSLTPKQRTIELAKFLSESNALSDRVRNSLTNEEDHLKARRPGECRITSKTDSVKIPFVPIYGDRRGIEAYGLDVAFNGKKRRLQIDTGASGLVLSPSAAKSLHLEPEYHLHTGGVGDDGKVDSYLTHVASIQIGGVEISDCMVEVLQKSKLDVDGLIGIDTFSRWLATLDYQNGHLLLNPLPPVLQTSPPPSPPPLLKPRQPTTTYDSSTTPSSPQAWRTGSISSASAMKSSCPLP